MKDKGFALILKAIDVSMDLRKLLVAVVGFAATMAVLALLMFLGMRTGAGGAIFFSMLALVAAWIGFSLLYGTITRMSYLHLTTGDAGTWQDAFGYATSHLVSLMFTGLALAVAALGIFIAEIILMLLGRIPYLGELIASLAFLPLTILNAFMLLVLIVGGWLIFPVIVAEDKGVNGAINRVVGLVRKSPGQIVAYLAIALILVGFASSIIFAIGYGGVALTTSATLIGGGNRLARVFSGFFGMPMTYSPYEWGMAPIRYSMPFTMSLAQLIYFIAMAGFFGLLASFPAVFMLSAATAAYINVAEEGASPSEETVPVGSVPPTRDVESSETRCANCGAALTPGQKFCPECGAPT